MLFNLTVNRSYLSRKGSSSLFLKSYLLLILVLGSSFTQTSFATPLDGRKLGVEFNIPRLITYHDEWKSLSGTFSYFNHHNHSEIALPWLVAKYGSDEDSINDTLINKSMDIHYRKFFDNKLGGFYFSGFARLSHYDGNVYTANDLQQPASSSIEKPAYVPRETQNFKKLRFGLGVGLGYRLFAEKQRMYWGTGIIMGRYLDDKKYNFVNDGGMFPENTPIIVDVELLKFGYAF